MYPFKKSLWKWYADKGLMKSFRMMYSNIGLSFRETLPLNHDSANQIRGKLYVNIILKSTYIFKLVRIIGEEEILQTF